MMRIAVLGASGFIGGRTVEMLHLLKLAQVRPVARTAAGLARSARFALEGRVADALDPAALEQAFAGCEVVVHAVAGDRETILGALAPVYRAAQAAGVRRLVYLSSASVHGQAPAPGTDERTPLSSSQPLWYNNAKVRAEARLLRLREAGAVELVLLRPGIVHGPRSTWITDFADALLVGRAAILGDGSGICNSMHVDNLVHAIHRAAVAPAASCDGEAFLVADAGSLTWWELYEPIVRALGRRRDDLHSVSPGETPAQRSDWWQLLNDAKDTPRARAILSMIPERLRYAVYRGLRAWHDFALAPAGTDGPHPVEMSAEMRLLQSSRYRLPTDKAAAQLGFHPPVSFAEGSRRTIGWLAFAGYPIVDADLQASPGPEITASPASAGHGR
jgi:nucleoside-diphosphate-sugar epimerase